MSKTNLVRPSRDGDQFHYLWAARRCLKLLSAESGLVAISIEGPSPDELAGTTPIEAGEELIDIAEYYGSEDISEARLVRYMQLKHSTLHTTDPWTASGLEKTISGFATRYREIQEKHPASSEKLEFWFVTNRPVSSAIVETVADAAIGTAPRHPAELRKIEAFTRLAGSHLQAFCKLVRFEDRQDDYWDQRNILFQDVSGYLPDSDVDAPTQLKELVTRRALSEAEQNPTITKIDVLRVLKTDESLLFPAPCLIANVLNAVAREQEAELVERIVNAERPVIVHASGGVGKSVFATRIGLNLPPGSESVLYDCFGNGQYRSVTGYRHRHRDALVQIVNELSSKSLCHLLIPTTHADASAYTKAFIHRLGQAATLLRLTNPRALLCVVIDAADNAEMAAEEIGEARSFVKDLIRATLPEGVRLVFLCRSHRQKRLDPPYGTIAVELQPFSRAETQDFLRQRFPDAGDRDVDEFHRLSSQNPRVQALALSRDLPLQETLRLLGPNPTSVEDAISGLLNDAIARLKDTSGPMEAVRVEKICSGLAALRPLIPIQVLSAMSGIEPDAIKSFAYDIGRPLLVSGETIQFLDEPAETWFREQFRPTASAMGAFIASLRPLARESAYVAASLPQLMLEAGQFDELVDLALSSSALPEGSPLEKRDIELQRMQFALKASLRSQRYLPAAKLALKAGGETAGDERQRKLLQANTDLAADFLELDLIQEIVSRRTFGSGWLGSHHAYEAALLSGRKELVGDARSRLRMAHEWLQNWARLKPEERKNESVVDQDIVELTCAHINIHGPKNGADSLKGWKPPEVSYRIGRLVARRLIDHGRYSELDDMAGAAGKNVRLALAIATELREVLRLPPRDIVEKCFSWLSQKRRGLGTDGGWDDIDASLDAVMAISEASLRMGLCTEVEAAGLLSRYLPTTPPQGLASRFSKSRFPLLRAYALRATLLNQPLELIDLAHSHLKTEIEKKNRHSTSREVQEFEEDIGTLLPWHKLWASVLLRRVTAENVASELKGAVEAAEKAERSYYRDELHTSNEVALLWMDIVHLIGAALPESIASLNKWKEGLKRPLFTPTLNSLARLCAQSDGTKPAALAYAAESFALTRDERSNADSKADGYLAVARAILTTSRDEAKAYFNEAVDVAGKIGDENLARWEALLDLADRASRPNRPSPIAAYQFSRCAELTYDYVVRDKHFPWNATVRSLCGLCPSSAFAILSRWRDRGFGWHEQLLPVAAKQLVQCGVIDARDVLPLVGFQAQWDYDELLGQVLSKCQNTQEEVTVAQILYRYARFSADDASSLSKLDAVASAHGLPLEGIKEAISFANRREEKVERNTHRHETTSPSTRSNPERDWDGIFASKTLTSPDGISQAYLSFKESGTPWIHEDFFRQLMQRIPAGSEAAFVEAFANAPDFDLYGLRHLLEQIPANWKSRPAILHALANTLKVFCRRYCMAIRKNRYYATLPLDTACELTGVARGELVDVILSAIGETPDLIETDRLFSLIGLIVVKLSEDEALEALTFGMALLDGVLEEKDGDGSWTAELAPPKDVRASIAGYIWAALAAPQAVLRWDAAHAVLETCRLNRRELLGSLMQIALARNGGPFVDARLHFYALHALQWLLIGLSRAALDAPEVLTEHADQLVDLTSEEQAHVLIRGLAARTILHLVAAGKLADDNSLVDRMRDINKSKLPIIDSKSYSRVVPRKPNNPIDDDDKFYFGIDIGPYWFSPLGSVFALSQGDVETEALKVIRNEFAYGAKGRWDEDERARRKLYEERHAHHSHGSYPRADNLQFYHAYHAMMIVAGRLLRTTPTHSNSDYGEQDEFADWLSRHDLTRHDGRWLWDRRDYQPFEAPGWLGRNKDDPNQRVVTNADFDGALRSAGQVILWGSWSIADYWWEQSTRVSSALVCREKSDALLRALATADDVYSYGIPTADDRLEISEPGFELKGWIAKDSETTRLDEMDRWAGGISFPPPEPAAFIIDLMELQADADKRYWSDKGEAGILGTQVWGHYDEGRQHERANPDRGSRLGGSLDIVKQMLKKLNRDLILEVQIGRHRRYEPYESGDKKEENVPTRAKLYLLGSDGNFRTV